LLGVEGIADFNGLHSRKHDDEVQLYAFDVLMSAGDDLRPLPCTCGRTILPRCCADVSTASFSTTSNRARSVLTCSGMPA
jgi:ATP-dependent DNA ligase